MRYLNTSSNLPKICFYENSSNIESKSHSKTNSGKKYSFALILREVSKVYVNINLCDRSGLKKIQVWRRIVRSQVAFSAHDRPSVREECSILCSSVWWRFCLAAMNHFYLVNILTQITRSKEYLLFHISVSDIPFIQSDLKIRHIGFLIKCGGLTTCVYLFTSDTLLTWLHRNLKKIYNPTREREWKRWPNR